MKGWISSLALIAAVAAATTVRAELIVPKGTGATLRVEYTYESAGNQTSNSKDQIRVWNFRRNIVIDANYVADAPQPFAVMHAKDGSQPSSPQASSAQAEAANATPKGQPSMQDMMKIVEQCGEQNQACITQRVMALASGGGAAAGSTGGTSGTGSFQLWRLASQTGKYSIDETYSKQVFEMTCTTTKVCKRLEVRKGAGPIPSPAGKSIAGASMIEVDGGNRDMVIALPGPLLPLSVSQTVTTTIPGETGGESQVTQPPWTLKATQPMTVKIPADALAVSGTQTIPVGGQLQDAGTITVKWQFTRQ